MNSPNSQTSSREIARGTAVVGGFNLLSRILGFIRDLLVARLFGASAIADAFVVAYRIPNLLRSFVGEGALTSAFVPIFSEKLLQGRASAQKALSEILGLLLACTTLLTVLGILYSNEITLLFAPGFAATPERAELSSSLLRIMFPYIMCVSIVAMLGGALNSMRIFGSAAIAQVAMNIVLIAGALLAGALASDANRAASVLAWSVLIGGVVQVLIQVPALKKGGLILWPTFKLLSSNCIQLIRLIWPAIIGASVYQIIIFINTVLASLLTEGSVSWLYYADRLVQLPLGIFSVALGTVLLPALSRAAAQKNHKDFAQSLSDALCYTNAIVVPLALVIYFLAHPIITVLFERGAFDLHASAMTAAAVQAYALGIWASSIQTMMVRPFLARKDTVTPTLIGLLSLIVTVLLSLLLMGPPLESSGAFASLVHSVRAELLAVVPGFMVLSLGHVGLAAASSGAATLSVVVFTALLLRRERAMSWLPVLDSLLRSVAASVVMLIVLGSLGVHDWPALWAVFGGGLLAGGCYLGAGLLFRSRELIRITQILRSGAPFRR